MKDLRRFNGGESLAGGFDAWIGENLRNGARVLLPVRRIKREEAFEDVLDGVPRNRGGCGDSGRQFVSLRQCPR